MKPIYCPLCKTATFHIYEDSDEMFVMCTNYWCTWKCRFDTIAETVIKRGEE